MGRAKAHMEAQAHKLEIATAIAVEAGVLDTCEHHGVTFQGDEEVDEAYKLGNTKWSQGHFVKDTFESRKEMTDFIKEAANCADHANYQCEACSDLAHDD